MLGKIAASSFIILFIQRRPQGLFALRGRVEALSAVSSYDSRPKTVRCTPAHLARRSLAGRRVVCWWRCSSLCLAPLPRPILVPLVGKFLCFGICALAMDLVWGYAGIL